MISNSLQVLLTVHFFTFLLAEAGAHRALCRLVDSPFLARACSFGAFGFRIVP